MDKITKDDVHKMIGEWNKLSITQSVASTAPTTTWTNVGPVYTFPFKQYDELDVIIFLYNRLVDEINQLKNK